MKFELNADNHVWYGILLIIDALSNKKADKFKVVFLSNEVSQNWVFQVKVGHDKLTVIIDKHSMDFKLKVGSKRNCYFVNLKNGNHELSFEDSDKYEKLLNKFLKLIKKRNIKIVIRAYQVERKAHR